MVRTIAICLLRDGDRVFVAEYRDPTGARFYRPLGGTVEFGEYARDCIIREVREEAGAEIREITYLGTIENISEYGGEMGHEIVLVYAASFADPRMHEIDALTCCDDGGEFQGMWVSLAELRKGPAPLYPQGVLDLLDGMPGRHIWTGPDLTIHMVDEHPGNL